MRLIRKGLYPNEKVVFSGTKKVVKPNPIFC